MLSAESSALSEMLLDDSVSVVRITKVSAAEMILFIVYLYNFVDADWDQLSKASKAHIRAAFVIL